MKVRLKFVPEDLWVGVWLDRKNWRAYICLVPCLPIVISTDGDDE